MKKAFITFLAVISAMIMFTACGSNGSSDNSNGSDSNDSSADTASDISAQDTTVSETEKASAATSGSDTAEKAYLLPLTAPSGQELTTEQTVMLWDLTAIRLILPTTIPLSRRDIGR